MEFDQGDQVAAHLKSKDGKVFSFDLLDSNGGEIRATCFNVIVLTASMLQLRSVRSI